jgi:hypothetical protein
MRELDKNDVDKYLESSPMVDSSTNKNYETP